MREADSGDIQRKKRGYLVLPIQGGGGGRERTACRPKVCTEENFPRRSASLRDMGRYYLRKSEHLSRSRLESAEAK